MQTLSFGYSVVFTIQTKTLSLIKIDDFHMIVKERKGEFEMDKEKMKRENDMLMNLEE